MEIQFVDTKIQTVSIKTLNPGDVFMIPDEFKDVCMNIGIDTEYGNYEYIVLGELPELDFVDNGDFQVRPVKAKLIVEI